MKIFLSGVGAAVVLMSLMAFGYFAHTASNVQQAGPIKLSDLPLNRSFQARVFVPGSTTMAFPSTSGIALTQLIVQGQPVGVFLDVNGARVYEGRADHFDPPIIVPPGGTLTLTMDIGSQNHIQLGGWTLGIGDV